LTALAAARCRPLPVAVGGCGAAVPTGSVTNDHLADVLDTSDGWIVERTGIRERRHAADHESTATLAVAAAEAALHDADLESADLGLIVVATSTPEQPLPATAAFVGDALGVHCGAFDLNAACSGFVYALVAAGAMVAAGTARHALVVGAETYSRILSPTDRATRVLFGDGAGAVVLSEAEGDGLLAWDLGCDGSAADWVRVEAGGSRMPPTPEALANGDHHLRMCGREVFGFAVDALVRSTRLTAGSAGVSLGDVDWVVPHQANARIIERAADEGGIPHDRLVLNVDRYGNTAAASIPIALHEAMDDGRLQPGDLAMLCSVGAGMTWASALLRWS